jgi:hypothetical protein
MLHMYKEKIVIDNLKTGSVFSGSLKSGFKKKRNKEKVPGKNGTPFL